MKECVLTEGMANASDATDVTALALNTSDTITAIMLPTWCTKFHYIYHMQNIACDYNQARTL